MKYADALILIDEIRKQHSRLNDWEKNFMQSVELQKEKDLTEKQGICLNRIYEKSVGGGIYNR